MTRKALGRGLNALFSDSSTHRSESEDTTAEELLDIDIDLIDPNPEQPRTNFNDLKMQELARSIRANGVVQPILLRRLPEGRFQLIAGERRWRAAQLAGLQRIQAVIRAVPDAKLLEFALIENIQRQELNPIEEAQAYQRLINTLGATQDQLAEQVGKDRSSIANYLRLLRLPATVQKMIEDELLSMGQARALAGLESPELQTRLAEEIIKRKFSVRQTEAAVKRLSLQRSKADSSTLVTNDANIRAAEMKLKRLLGAQVRIRLGQSGGKMEISFASVTDLDRIYSIIMSKTDTGSPLPTVL
jgi:ParB family chromosome partitioning protein